MCAFEVILNAMMCHFVVSVDIRGLALYIENRDEVVVRRNADD